MIVRAGATSERQSNLWNVQILTNTLHRRKEIIVANDRKQREKVDSADEMKHNRAVFSLIV